MRIIAGSARGVPLKAPKGRNTRPTSDRVRESLFAILGDLYDVRVLDLFAGSGALGIEALSRGAKEVVFVDKDRQAIKVVQENLAKVKLAERALVLPVDTLRFLSEPQRYLQTVGQEPFDLVFIDPPYTAGLYEKVLSRVVESALCAPAGLVVVEQSSKSEVLPQLAGFNLQRSERYGDTIICFYRQPDMGEFK